MTDLRIEKGVLRGPAFDMLLDGRVLRAYEGESVAAAILASGARILRVTRKREEPRSLFCGIGKDHVRGRKLLDEAARSGVSVLSGAMVWDVTPGSLSCCQGDRSWTLAYQSLILATGAYERAVPFPGWTLPGVFTSGAAQTLLKVQRVLAGERVLLAGTGPLNLVVANQLADAGAQVVAVLELAKPGLGELLPMLGGPWELLADGIGYVARLVRRGIPILRGWTIVEARGKEQVTSAVITQADKEWRPIAGSERTLQVDTVCLGFGLVPATDVRAVLEEGATSLIELKARLRSGMGLCQGRICSPTLVELVTQSTGRPADTVRAFSPRPPVKPIPLAALLNSEEADR